MDIIIGKNSILEALKKGVSINKILLSDSLHRDAQINNILQLLKEAHIPFSWIPRKKIDSLAEGQKHQGIIAYRNPYRFSELEEILSLALSRKETPFLLILDGIQDPHNLGAIIRTAETAGVHGIIIPKHRACPITSTLAKTSAGAIEHVLINRCANINTTIDILKEKGVWIIGVEANAQNNCYNTDLTGPIALVLGSEGKGISALTLKKCDVVVKIPMKGKINSLNVSAAGAIIIYEALKQNMIKSNR